MMELQAIDATLAVAPQMQPEELAALARDLRSGVLTP